jgi:hypothetical protein
MSLSEKIADDFKVALKTGDKDKVSVLRLIKSTMKNKEIEKKTALTDEEIQAILRSFVKRGKESIEQFSKAGRSDLVEKEKKELSLIQDYLPRQLSEDEVKKVVSDIMNEQGLSGPKDLGKAMKAAMARLRGQADGKLLNNIVKEMLET